MVTCSRNTDVVEALDLSKVDSVDYCSHEDLTIKLTVNYECSCYAKKIAQRLKLIYWNAEVNGTALTTTVTTELLNLILLKRSKVAR